ncbi:MAG TPA: 3-hydroxyacyl-CoA dehydrogenase NAD-binding domain-containing protein [Bryobacteraceae bacterium]
MDSVVAVIRVGDVAVIEVNHPPVNALSQAVRAGLLAAIREADADAGVRAVVIRCQGTTFIAGADISEFGKPPQAPHLPEVTEAIENCSKPVVAAIHGTALGGGFEIALACHYRVAASDAKVGLPEVKLGLMPGAGGTQRLPRLIGAQRALQMIVEGEPVPAAKALEWGAIDKIADIAEMADIAEIAKVAAGGARLCRTSQLPSPAAPPELFAEAQRTAATKQRGLIAPQRCIEIVRVATTTDFAEGVQQERAAFLTLRQSPQAAALRHAFFGERTVARHPSLPAETPVREVRSAGIIGAGTMGSGIAMCFANAGLPVTLLESDGEALERGVETIRRNWASSVARGRMTEAQLAQRMDLIRPTLSYDDLSGADLLIEAAFEDLAVKKQVFEKMDQVARAGAILATNTSYLDVATIAGFTRRPQDVVGMHFFSPAHVMKLVENVRTPETAADVLATVMKLGKKLGKVAVLVGGCDGFVGNRMLAQRTREAYFLLEEGALPEQVDRALYEFGFPMGPFAVGDLSGLDIGWRNRKSRAHLRKPGVRDSNLLDKVCEMGRLGQKTGAGWYRYEKGNRSPLPDPVIEQLIVEHSRQAGIERRVIGDQEIVERCLYSMINEGARILAEGVAARPLDVDMVWLHGYGFPAHRGGPMFYADQVGLDRVLEQIRLFENRLGADFWTAAPLLEKLADAGQGFYSGE